MSRFLKLIMNFVNRISQLYRPDVAHQQRQEQTDDQPDTEPSVGQTALEQRQETLAHIVRLVARGKSQGAVFFGERGGLGKTRVVMRTLRQEGHSPVTLSGHCTPLSLYENLLNHPSGIIVLDDCEALARNISSLGILRSALWGETQSQRLVTYTSSQIKIPTSFYFSGRIILICNVLPKNSPAWNAVASRIDQYELDATNEEVIELMRRLADAGYKNEMMPSECHDVVNYIEQFATTRNISLRLLTPSYEKFLYAHSMGCDWKELVATQLIRMGGDKSVDGETNGRARELALMSEAASKFPDAVRDQERFWRDETGKSRASFFRAKKLWANQTENNHTQG